MLYSKEEKQKIYDAIDQIKAYITTLQPQIRDRITIDFGPIETYANYERESAYHLYVYPDDISGRSGGLGISFAKKKDSSTSSTVYVWLDYTVALIKNWPHIKKTLLDEIAKQNATIAAINNFKI